MTEFDKDALATVVRSERTWLVTLVAENGEAPPEVFHFPQASLPLKESVYQRYDDADLVSVEPEISLVARYGERSLAWLWLPLVGLALVAAGGVAAFRAARGRHGEAAPRFQLPDELTPFTVLGLLRDIQHNDGLGPADREELGASIDRLERHYFADAKEHEPDLRQIAADWLARSSQAR